MKKAITFLFTIFLLTACGDSSSTQEQVVQDEVGQLPSQVDSPSNNSNQEDSDDLGEASDMLDLASLDDEILIHSPRIGEKVSSPLTVMGEARGPWFFEASFLVRLVDENNEELALGVAMTTDEWMTEDFVPFTAELNFDPGSAHSGRLIFEKENPSELPENAGYLEVPVSF